ncbi:MAG: KUP/HAK/KT family potassium transporter [Planctomycetes bacterium]|nr:KUP/HAK/KT family potassium transporter [Planctomycetota bacterium]
MSDASSVGGAAHEAKGKTGTARFWALALGSVGVVFGDIGTSPLYALRACLVHRSETGPIHEEYIYGILSLLTWALLITVNLKYLLVILRATNHGEGGIFSLLSLIPRTLNKGKGFRTRTTVVLAMLGAGLLFGDGLITPSISVLSAVEGLKEFPHAPAWLAQAVLPTTIAILVALFAVQQFGTHSIGWFFGPVMILWFLVLAAMGLQHLMDDPEILKAADPRHIYWFVRHDPFQAFTVLGAVVLVVTGAEALYADVGHFGKAPIQIAWYAIVLPSLLLNYYGQGAYVLGLIRGGATDTASVLAMRPFFGMAAEWAIVPLVLLATAATIIASQAMISGVFGLARQAVRLGYLPRLRVIHTSSDTEGQIYMPSINFIMLIGCVITVILFPNSEKLGSAYGIAVTGNMIITTILFSLMARRLWKWRRWQVVAVAAFFLSIDGLFFSANLLKAMTGGWFALTIALGATMIMMTWQQGSFLLGKKLSESMGNIHEFLASLWAEAVPRVPGTAVFLTTSNTTPFALVSFVEHSHVLHQQVILVSVVPVNLPVAPPQRQIKLTWMPDGFYKLSAQCGFMESPDIPKMLEKAREHGLKWDPETTTYFARHVVVLPTGDAPMALWRKRLFASLTTVATDSVRFFNLPPSRVVEFGVQMEL